MANTVLLKKSGVAARAPQLSDLSLGEVALNYKDGYIYYRDGELSPAVHKLNADDADTVDGFHLDQGVLTTSSPSFAGLTVDTNTLFVDSSNNRVGIGTTSPDYNLDIGGDTGSTSNTIRMVQAANGTAIRIGAGGGANDVTLLRVDGSFDPDNRGESDSSNYGFSMKYFGSGAGNDNRLGLLADNQNASTQVEAITILQDGSVGIGTTSPIAKLSVYGGANISGNVGIGTTSASQKLDVSGTAVISGNVGIGTTSPIAKLDIRTPQTTAAFTNPALKLLPSSVTNDTGLTSISLSTTDTTTSYGFSMSAWRRTGDDTFTIKSHINTATGVDRLVIRSNGNVGIGTINPSQKLDVYGGAVISGNVGIGKTSPSQRLDVAGNIAVSGYLATNTASNRSKLSVYGTSGVYAIGMESAVTFAGLNDWAMTFQFNNVNSRGFWWGDDAHSKAQGAMALTTDGLLTVASKIKVGFGESDTTSPDAPLQIASGTTLPITTAPNGSITFGSSSSTTTPVILGRTTNGRNGLSLFAATSNANAGGDMLFNVRENDNSTFSTLTNTAFRFQHYTSDLLRILRNGNVGIGVTSPTEKLEVAGNIVADNFFSHPQVMSHSIGTYTASTINSATATNEGGGMGLAAGATSTGQAAVRIDRFFAAGRSSGLSTRLDYFHTVVGASFTRTFVDDTEAFINIGTGAGTPVAPTETTKGVFVVLKKVSGVYTLELHHNRGTAATNSSTSATVSVNLAYYFQIEIRTTPGGTIEVFTSNDSTPPTLLLSLTGLTFGQNGGANDNNVWLGYRSTGYSAGNYGIGVKRVYSGYYRT